MKSLLLLLPLCAVALAHPVPESPLWLTYPGGNGPGKGRHIVLIAADQEYRSEQSMPMMARILSTHHGFDCTVLFGVNERGEVDPTLPVYPEKGKEAEFKEHHIPGTEHLASADLVLFFTRLLTLPKLEQEHIVKYVDSGKPIIALRTANHGFRTALPYRIHGRQVRWGEDVLGGTFLEHHGQWQADSTRGRIVEEQRSHPVLTGVTDILGQLGRVSHVCQGRGPAAGLHGACLGAAAHGPQARGPSQRPTRTPPRGLGEELADQRRPDRACLPLHHGKRR